MRIDGLQDLGAWSSQGSSDRSKKSILKHRDPETEQLIPGTDSPVRKNKIPPPVKFVGVNDDDDDDERYHSKRLPRSPLPFKMPSRAPLADLLADFDGQEISQRSDESVISDALLDQQNANTEMRCSRQNCKLNSPAQSSSVIQDPLIAPYCIPLCICGAPMTRVPANPSNDLNSISLIVDKLAGSDKSIGISMNDKTPTNERINWPSAAAIYSVSSTQNGTNDRSLVHINCKPENTVLAENLNNEDDHFVDDPPTEETKLLERPPCSRGNDKQSK